MPFDLSTARPVKPTGFDINTAKLADRSIPRSPMDQRPRAEVEAELAQREAAANAAEASPWNVSPQTEQAIRGTGIALTGLAKGVAGLPAMVEQGIAAPIDALAGREVVPRVLRAPIDALSPPELAPRNSTEGFVDRASQLLGGALEGTAVGQNLAQGAVSPVTRAVGQAVADMPGRQALGAWTGASAGQMAHDAGAGPLVDMLATTLGSGTAFAGARPPNLETPLGAPPISSPTSRARQWGFHVTPDYAATEAQRAAPAGQAPSVPGRFRASFAGPEGDHAIMVENSKTINRVAAQHVLGVSPDTPLTPTTFAIAKNEPNQVFNRVAQEVPNTALNDQTTVAAIDSLGARQRENPLLATSAQVEELRQRIARVGAVPTQNALDAIRQWRRDANVLFQSIDDPKKLEMARAYRTAADAVEEAIGRSAAAYGSPELAAQIPAARTRLAQIHNLEDSMVGTDVDARKLAKLGQTAPLSGALADIADAGTHFPDIARPATGVQRPTPSASGMLATLHYGARRLAGEGLIPGLLSEKFQGRFGEFDPSYNPGDTRPDFAGDPFAPPPPSGPELGAGSVEFTPTPGIPPGFRPAGDAPGLQPGAAVGRAGEMATDPYATVNPWPEIPGPHGPEGSPLEGPQPPPGFTPDQPLAPLPAAPSLADLLAGLKGNDAVPWNSDISQLVNELTGPAESPRTIPSDLPNNQNLADLGPPRPALPDSAGSIEQLLADLGVQEGPPRPIEPQRQPGAASGRSIADALAEQDIPNEPAAPSDFPALGGLGDEFTVEDTGPAAPKAPEFNDTRVDVNSLPPPANLPKGEAVTLPLHRGGPEGADLTAAGYEGGTFYAPDEAGAKVYGPQVVQHQVQFNNLLRVGTMADAVKTFGLPSSAGLNDIIARARQLGYDGLEYTVPYGPKEFVKL